MNPGGRDESGGNVAVHETPTNVPELFVVAPAGMHVAAAQDCCCLKTAPARRSLAELLFELTVDARHVPPDVTLAFGVTQSKSSPA
jgi:hypothetical protein